MIVQDSPAWRAIASDLLRKQKEREQSAEVVHSNLLCSSTFVEMCEKVGLRPSRRQASKYRRGKGKSSRVA